MSEVILVDENDNEIGTMPMVEAHTKELLHRVVATFVVNGKGDILIQERVDSGKLDHSSAGHVDPGETYREAAERELFEELGISGAALEEFGFVPLEWSQDGFGNRPRHMFKCFVCVAEPGTTNPHEVKSVFWADPKEVLKDMQNDPAHKKYTSGFKRVLKMYLERFSSV